MEQHITPGPLSGTLTAPPSKSQVHRAVIAAALAEGTSRLSGVYFSQDISATVSAMKSLGAKAVSDGDRLVITGQRPCPPEGVTIDCGESGSTLRFLIPLALLSGKKVRFTGHGRLMERPLDPYFAICESCGISYEKTADAVSFCGTLRGGHFSLPGNISSQFITGLLFALPLAEQDSTIELTTEAESVGYIDMTLDILRAFGVSVQVSADYKRYEIPGRQTYCPQTMQMEGDYSQAAFYLCANALGSHVTVLGLRPESSQGDKAIMSLLERFGSPLRGITLDVSQIPDLVPIISVVATQAEGETKLVNGARLRIKESDRLATTKDMLSRFGACIRETEDGLIICGKTPLSGCAVDSHNDHRIAMAAAIAATVAEGETTVLGAECVAKSYGNFWEDFKSLQQK